FAIGMSREYVLQPFRPAVDFQIDYAHELNEQQYAAVTAPPGPSLVLAGAGAGKTRTLIYRVAYLIEQGVPADRILLLTFTNKAAREMMRRVTDLLGEELGQLWGGTFHAIGQRFLRKHAEAYQARKRAANVMDFDDLLVLWLKLLQEQTELRESYQRKFQFVLVDEYQDTNTIQGEIIDLLAARHKNVMVVGDDSQSIYSWRGANFQNILKFP